MLVVASFAWPKRSHHTSTYHSASYLGLGVPMPNQVDGGWQVECYPIIALMNA